MATSTIGSTGNYADLNAWATNSLVYGTSDATEIAELLDEDHGNDAGADITGFTNTPDVIIRGQSAQDGDFGTGARFTRSSGGFIVTCTESDISVTMEDIALDNTGGLFIGLMSSVDGGTYSDGLGFALRRCISKTTGGYGCAAISFKARSTTISVANRIALDVENCVFAHYNNVDSNALELGYSGSGRQNMEVTLRGCTLYDSTVRFGSGHGDSNTALTARGCLWKTPSGVDALVDVSSGGTHDSTSDFCILDESSATHTADWTTSANNSYDVTFNDSGVPASGEVSFTDAANDDYSLVDSANNLAIDFVTSGSMPSADILGTARDSNPDAGAFEIASANTAPVSNAGPDQSVAKSAVVTLDGTGSSDPDGDPITYSWSQTSGPAATLSSTTASQPTFTASTAGTLVFELEVSDGSLTHTDTVTITVTNTAPVSNAGPDQSVAKSAVVTLDGTGSSDPNGDAITYSWTQTLGTAVTLSSTTVAQPTFTASTAETLTFQLEVSDGSLTDTDTVTITVTNTAPVADAGPDQTVAESALVTLDGTGSSDPNGDAITYAWTQTAGTAVTLSDAAASQPTFTAGSAETLIFQLEVSDGSLTHTDTVTITVTAANLAPVANAGPGQTVASSSLVTLDGSVSSDPNGDPITYSWSQTSGPAVTLSSTTVAQPTFTAPVTGTLVFELEVSDGSLTDTDTVTITATGAVTTVTSLTSYASTYSVGRQHVHFDVRSSTPAPGSGAMNDRDAQGYWWVERGGSIIQREFGTLDFGWLGLDGDVIHAAAVDSAGNVGNTVTYTFSVTPNTSADVVRYVNGSTGSDSNDGSSGSPWATLTHATTQVKAAFSADGEVGVIFLAGGQTYTESTQQGSDTDTNLIRVVWDGTGGTRPHIDWADEANGFNRGKRFSWHLEGLDLDGNDTDVQNSSALNGSHPVDGSVITERSPPNCMMVSCNLQRWGNGITFYDEAATEAERENGYTSFVAFEDITMSTDAVMRYGIYGMNLVEHWLIRRITITGPQSNGYSPVRVFLMGRGYAEDFHSNTTAANTRFRLLGGPTTDAAGGHRLHTWNRLQLTDGGDFGACSLEMDPGNAGLAYWNDVRFLNCKIVGSFELAANKNADNMCVPKRMDVINMTSTNQISLQGNDISGGVMRGLRLRGCGTSRNFADQNFITITGSAARYADGFLDVEGCFIYWPQTGGFSGGGHFVETSLLTRAELIAKFGDCDYNIHGKVDGQSSWWASHPSDGGSSRSTLAEWLTANSNTLDTNSSVETNTTLSLTDDGYPTNTTIDLRLTDDLGPLSGAGRPLPSGVALDADSYLRDATTPDAGPYEFGASTQPTDPIVGNTTPVANAGPDQSVAKSAVVTLDGTGSSDPDADPITYSWTQNSGPAVTLSDATASQPTFTASTEGTLVFQLEVSDGSLTDTDTVMITVTNTAPVSDAGPDQSVLAGSLVTLDGTGSSDPNGDALTYSWTQTAGTAVTLSDATASQPTFTAGAVDTLTFQLEVSDGSLTDTDTVTITVNNNAPVANAGPDQSVAKGAVVTLDGTGSSDPDSDPLSYLWSQSSGPAATLSGTTASQPTFTASTAGTLVFQLQVDDGTDTDTDTVTITVTNTAPVAEAGPAQSVAKGTVVTLDGTGSSDPNGDALTYSWTQNSGPAVALSDASASQPTFTASDSGSLVFELEVSDGSLTHTDTVTITVTNTAPVASAGSDQSVVEGSLVTLDGSASSDPNGDSLTYLWSQTGGTAVTLSDTASAQPTFTAPLATTLVFQLQVDDGEATDTDTVTVTVSEASTLNPAVITSTQVQGWNVSATAQTDPAATSYTWDWGDGETSTTQDGYHTYVEGGDYTITLTISDGVSEESTTTSVTIQEAGRTATNGEVTQVFGLIKEGVVVYATKRHAYALMDDGWTLFYGRAVDKVGPIDDWAYHINRWLPS